MSRRRDAVDSGPFVEWLDRWRWRQDAQRYCRVAPNSTRGFSLHRQFAADSYSGDEESRPVAGLGDLAELAGVSPKALWRARATGRVSIAVVDRVLVAAGADVFLIDLYPDLYPDDVETAA